MTDIAQLLAVFRESYRDEPIRVDSLTWRIADLDSATARELLVSRPDLFTLLPAHSYSDEWVLTGSRYDPRKLVLALGEASPSGTTVSELAAQFNLPKAHVLRMLDALKPGVASRGIGPPSWFLTQPVARVVRRIASAPPDPYGSVRPEPPRPLTASEVRQRMMDQVPAYRERLRTLAAEPFQRPGNQASLTEALRALAALDRRFTEARFRELGSLVRRLERERVREQTPTPIEKELPKPNGSSTPKTSRSGSSAGVPRHLTPYRNPWGGC